METGTIINRRGRRKVLAGLIVVAVGTVLLLKEFGTIFPAWLFTWKALLIVIGLYLGAKRGFRGGGWMIVTLVGAVFLAEDFIPGLNISNIFWPTLLILFGLIMIFRPSRHRGWCGRHHGWNRHRLHRGWNSEKWGSKWEEKGVGDQAGENPSFNKEDCIDSTNLFGGVRKVILSKDFKGGRITNTFGGVEINLSQADISGKVILDIEQVFGGLKLVIPPHWNVQSEIKAVFAGTEDKRPAASSPVNPDKILVLQGSSLFSGIEIVSY